MSERQEEARKLARRFAGEFLTIKELLPKSPYMGEVYSTLCVVAGVMVEELPDGNSCLYLRDEMHLPLLSAARHNAEAYQLAQHIIASRVMHGAKLSGNLAAFAADIILGNLSRPSDRKSTKRAKNGMRDIYIASAVKEICKATGLSPTRNRERSAGDTTSPSAAQIVASAFADAGMNEVTERAVEEVLHNPRKKLLRKQRSSEASVPEIVGVRQV